MSRVRSISIKKSLLIGLPLLLLMLVLLTSIWLLASNSGGAWLWHKVEGFAAGSLHSRGLEGDLASGFVIHDLVYDSADMKVVIGRAELQASPGVWPFSVHVQQLLLHEVAVISKSPQSQSGSAISETDIPSLIEALKLPLPLDIHKVELTNISFQKDDMAALKLVDLLSFKLHLDERLALEQLIVSSDLFEATAQASLLLEAPFELTALIESTVDIPASPLGLAHKQPFLLQASGDLDRLLLELENASLDLDINAQVRSPLSELEWDISAVLNELPRPLDIAGEQLAVSALTLSSKGGIGNWSMELVTDLGISGQQDAKLAISANGSGAAINIQRASLVGSGVDLLVQGRLDSSPQLDAKLQAVIAQLDFSPWIDDWPNGQYLSAELELDWSAKGLRIPAGKLGVSNTELLVDISADIDLENNLVDGHLGWNKLSWPLESATPLFYSPSGQLDVNGSVDQWTGAGQLALKVGEYPQGDFQIEGSGDRDSIHVEIPAGQILGGSLSGMMDVDWAKGSKWSLDLLAQGVDPEPLLPGWPGHLDVEFGIKGDSETQQLQLNIETLEGMLAGTQISGSGNLEMVEQQIHFDQLEFHSDDAVLRLNGKLEESAGLTATFSGQLPSLLLQGASGNVEMQGRFSNHAGRPLVDMQLQALDLAWDDLGIKALAVNTGEPDANSVLPALDVSATELIWKDDLIDEISVSIRPDGIRNTLQASIVSELLDLNTSIDFVPENSDDLLHGRWDGVFNELNLLISESIQFNLVEHSPFSLSSDALLLKSACLTDANEAGLCVGVDHRLDSGLSLNADVTALPLDYLRAFLELDIKLEQKLDGKFEWQLRKGQAPTGGADFRISAGRVLDLIDDETLLSSSDGIFKFELRNGNLESGMVDVEFPGVGFIDIDFEVLDLVKQGGRQLQGRALSQLNDIKSIGELFLPGVDDVGGRFDSNIGLGGTLDDPEFEGGFKLTNGFFYYAPLGLKLEEVDVDGKVDRHDRGSLKGQFTAGKGVGIIDGRIVFENIDHMEMDLSFSGDQLLLVNTETLVIETETRLEVGLAPQRIDINGQIRVPKARLTPANLLLSTVSDSEDLIIERRGQQKVATDDNKPARNQIFGKLEVSFGDDVYVKVPGVETNISGSVVYNWSGAPVPLAEGAYVLKGKVDVYGPTLEITNGTINFPGVPANNPLLSIRAQRDIFGNTQIRSAGVQIIGNLKRPVLEAYTVPVTNEDRAWTLLVTGSDFDQGQGVGGFDVGTYIAPKLYVSYGISLFEDENVVSARYDLKKGFGIKVTSGQRETGLDMSYTIDK
jgi:translocation and assembly module TamB